MTTLAVVRESLPNDPPGSNQCTRTRRQSILCLSCASPTNVTSLRRIPRPSWLTQRPVALPSEEERWSSQQIRPIVTHPPVLFFVDFIAAALRLASGSTVWGDQKPLLCRSVCIGFTFGTRGESKFDERESQQNEFERRHKWMRVFHQWRWMLMCFLCADCACILETLF